MSRVPGLRLIISTKLDELSSEFNTLPPATFEGNSILAIQRLLHDFISSLQNSANASRGARDLVQRAEEVFEDFKRDISATVRFSLSILDSITDSILSAGTHLQPVHFEERISVRERAVKLVGLEQYRDSAFPSFSSRGDGTLRELGSPDGSPGDAARAEGVCDRRTRSLQPADLWIPAGHAGGVLQSSTHPTMSRRTLWFAPSRHGPKSLASLSVAFGPSCSSWSRRSRTVTLALTLCCETWYCENSARF